MKNKKVKKLIGCICAGSLLLGAIPTNGIVASATDTTLEVEDGVEFYDTAGNKLDEAKYSLHGVSYDSEEGVFVRMKLEDAEKIANTDSVYKNGEWGLSVYSLAREASGGRIRFNTNSPTITIEAELYNWDAAHVEQGGKMEAAKYGFDIYEDTADGSTYVDTVVADTKDADGDGKIDPGSVYVNQTITLGDAQYRDITLYFPVVIETKNVKIKVAEGSTVQEHKNGYEGNGRVVFYGNSITQGGVVNKPGSNYVNTTLRNLNLDFINLGVWGSCKGETAFAEYIANMDDISMLVMDYDGNESRASVLEKRHYPFYEIVRAAHPDIPIVLLTRSGNRLQVNNAGDPDRYSTTAELKEVIRQTYETAKAAGDENVHYVDGEIFFRYSYAYLPDGVHGDTAGHQKMADVLTVVLEEVLAGAKNLCIEPSSCIEPTPLAATDFTDEENETVQLEDFRTGASNILDEGQKCYVITKDDGNKVYQIEFIKKQNGGVVTFAPRSTVWDGQKNLAVELDAELHIIDNEPPLLGVKIGEGSNNSADQKYEVRVKATEEGYVIYFYDGTKGTNPSDAAKTTKVKDQNFISMYAQGKVAFNLRITQTPVRRDGVDTFDIDVYINDMLVAGYALSPQAGFEPNNFKIFCYGIGTNEVSVSRALIDNLKAYVIPTHQLSYITTEGMREHYVCSECGKKFLDEKGIIRVTDADLVITNDCIEMLFSEDFEGNGNWGLTENYTGTDTVGIVQTDDGHAYQLGVTREEKSYSSHIKRSATALATEKKYTIQFETILYRATLDDGTSAGNRWPSLTFMLYDTSTSGYFDIRIIPKGTGFETYLREKQGSSSYDHNETTVEDSTLAVSSSKTEVLYDVRIDVKTYEDDENNTRWQFLLYVGDNDAVVFDFEPYYEGIAINQLRFYAYPSTIKETTHFKTRIDNIMVYTDSHTLTSVPATPSTNDEAGLKAHYACSVCGKKFLDEAGEIEVTNKELAYAKLTDIICQTKTNAENSDNKDIRFLVYVGDYTQYQSVTFKITCSAGTGTAICKYVYTGVYAGGQLYTTEDIFGADGYFATFILKNNTPADLEDTMTVVATWKAIDGAETTETRIVNVSKEQR